jgi:GntR family transcriptional regulator
MSAMKFAIDLTSRNSAYLQIMGQVKRAVANGALKPGDQLPTVRQMAADLLINFNTVARAYRLLDEEGIISTQHGRGTYILEPPSARDSARMRQRELTLLAEHFVSEAEKLNFSPDEVRSLLNEQIDAWKKENGRKAKKT